MATADSLSPAQARALFDILTHHETYSEISQFKRADAIRTYGPPFQDDSPSTSPTLQTLLTWFVLPLPGMRDVSADFWPGKVEPLIAELSRANLSESFDKGGCGQRKTLATASSALLEYIARGKFGGLPKRDVTRDRDDYDLDDPQDLVAAFEDLLQGLVYGDVLDRMADDVARTAKLDDHPMLVQAAHRFMLINAASFLHYTLIVSDKGPALIGLLDAAHRLIPYTIIRQTLRVGNAATMISGMVKIVLAKASVGAVTNWLGLSQGWAEGMNLMQTIVYTVLGWDIRGLKKQVAQLEKGKDIPSKEQLEELRNYTKISQDEQEQRRDESRKHHKTLVSVVLEPKAPLAQPVVKNGAAYLALQLAIEDRTRLTSVLCQHNPDLLTPAVRALVNAFDPVIRRVHEAVDLAAGLSDAENFINDLVALAKPPSTKGDDATTPPNVPVSSFVRLCEKHQDAVHRYLHQLAKNGPEITGWYKDWVKSAAVQFRKAEDEDPEADSLTDRMSKLLSYLSPTNRGAVMEEVDAQVKYLEALSSSSGARAKALVSAIDDSSASLGSNTAGPGVFLTKWQSLLDETEIGPTEDGATTAELKDLRTGQGITREADRAPNTERTVKYLLDAFRDMIRAEAQQEAEVGTS